MGAKQWLSILIISDLNICSGGENRYATPLQMAARFNSPATARLLIFHGADVTKQSNYGQQALHYAARRGNLAVVEVGCFFVVYCNVTVNCQPNGKNVKYCTAK